VEAHNATRTRARRPRFPALWRVRVSWMARCMGSGFRGRRGAFSRVWRFWRAAWFWAVGCLYPAIAAFDIENKRSGIAVFRYMKTTPEASVILSGVATFSVWARPSVFGRQRFAVQQVNGFFHHVEPPENDRVLLLYFLL